MSFALRRGVCQDFAQVLNMRASGRKSSILRLRANERLTQLRRTPAWGCERPGEATPLRSENL
jgi:hypothetical protein